jgi:hypothetical protein
MYWAGETAEAVCDDYDLNRHELAVVLWYEGEHGDYRDRWQDWARNVAYPRLAGWVKPLDIDTLPLPPDQNGDVEGSSSSAATEPKPGDRTMGAAKGPKRR